MSKQLSVSGAHLVGSAPVSSAEQMFTMVSQNLGNHVNRIGDGEVGERDNWILFQNERLATSPQLEKVSINPLKGTIRWCIGTFIIGRKLPDNWGLKSGITEASQIELPELGYTKAATESYQTFEKLKSEDVIPLSPSHAATIESHR